MSAQSYDNKQAYNKGLTAKARFHYLEDSIHDTKKYGKSAAKMKGSPSYMSDSQEKTDLTTDMPVDSRASTGSAMQMKGSFMSKHCRK